jgi:hypothetical protein
MKEKKNKMLRGGQCLHPNSKKSQRMPEKNSPKSHIGAIF